MRAHPYLPKRVAALRLFANTHYFRGLIGNATDSPTTPALSKEECDAKVADILAIIKR
jgi:hypothetical protein